MNKNIIVLSNNADFCMNVTHNNSSLGYISSFPSNSKEMVGIKSDVVIVDLNDSSMFPFEIIKKDFILIGVMNKLNKNIERKAKINYYDIVFTKKMFISNYQTIIKQVVNA